MKASAKHENPRYCTYEDLRIGVLVSDSAVIAATCKRLKSVEDFVLVSDYLSTLPSPEVPPAGGGWVVLGFSRQQNSIHNSTTMGLHSTASPTRLGACGLHRPGLLNSQSTRAPCPVP